MEIRYYLKNDISIDFPIVIYLAQMDVKFDDSNIYVNTSFDLEKFEWTIKAFNDGGGNLIVFPEYYLPIKDLFDVNSIIVKNNRPNKVYLIPLSQMNLREFIEIKSVFNINAEKININKFIDQLLINITLVILSNNTGQLTYLSQMKTHPSLWESKPYKEIVKGKELYIYSLKDKFTFCIPICFSFFGKEFEEKVNLQSLLPFIQDMKIDCLFVPEWNEKPLHPIIIEAINNVCKISKNSISLFFINMANGVGNSSIVDLFSGKFITEAYEINDIDIPKYRHCIFVPLHERLFRYEYYQARKKILKLSPNNIREIPIDEFEFEKGKGWIKQQINIEFEYRHIENINKFNGKIFEIRKTNDILNYLCNLSMRVPLDFLDDWEEIIGYVINLTQEDFIKPTHRKIKESDLVWICKLMGEYHDKKNCRTAAYYYYNVMHKLACKNQIKLAIIISEYLLMSLCSYYGNPNMQRYALDKALEFEKELTEIRKIRELTTYIPIILGTSALLISHYSGEKPFIDENMFRFGSSIAALNAQKYNKMEIGKHKRVKKLLTMELESIETSNLEDPERFYLQYLDVTGLSDILFAQPESALNKFEEIMRSDPIKRGYFHQDLATEHNIGLHKQIYENSDKAKKSYFEILQKQLEWQKFESDITLRNLLTLIKDEELRKYLTMTQINKKQYHDHSNDSLLKAKMLYQFSDEIIRKMW